MNAIFGKFENEHNCSFKKLKKQLYQIISDPFFVRHRDSNALEINLWQKQISGLPTETNFRRRRWDREHPVFARIFEIQTATNAKRKFQRISES